MSEFEELMDRIRHDRERRNSRVIDPVQEQITWGSTCIRFVDGLVIFAEVETAESLLAEDVEVRQEIERLNRSGTFWCRCYSLRMVEGEFGYVHRSVLYPLPLRAFEEARRVDWQVGSMANWAQFDVTNTYYTMRNHLREGQT